MDRLHSFSGLVKNEYIKIYKKTSTRILFVIFIAIVICYPGIAKLVNNSAMSELGKYNDNNDWRETSIQEDITKLKNSDDKNGLAKYKTEALEAVDTTKEWQYNAAVHAMLLKKPDDKQDIQKITMMIKTDDWRGYCKYRKENAAGEGEAWSMQYRLDHDVPFDGEEYEKENKIISEVSSALDGVDDGVSNLSAADRVIVGKYMLDNKIYDNTSEISTSLTVLDPYEKFSFWDVLMKTPFLVSGIGYIMLALAGSCVANEFSQGTIKFLLINPVSRWKILMAKYFTVISMGFILMIVTLLLSIPMTGVFFGFNGISAPYLAVEGGDVVVKSTYIYLFKTYLIASVGMVVMATMAFMISCLAKSSVLAIIIGFVMNSVGGTITMIMNAFHLDWGRYFIFANTDLLSIYNGASQFAHHTVGFALMVIAAHMAVFMLTAWDAFTRRSV